MGLMRRSTSHFNHPAAEGTAQQRPTKRVPSTQVAGKAVNRAGRTKVAISASNFRAIREGGASLATGKARVRG
jgi:hypothetical protein